LRCPTCLHNECTRELMPVCNLRDYSFV
jgi:hypothetical protein